MELILLIGIPGSGKSSFYRDRFFNRCVRISLDLLNTKNKETKFIELALMLQQRIVIDNTNVLKDERAYYINRAKANKFKVVGYYFESKLSVCLERNERRLGKEKINRIGILSKYNALELPTHEEGFDALYYVRILNNEFIVNDWNNEI